MLGMHEAANLPCGGNSPSQSAVVGRTSELRFQTNYDVVRVPLCVNTSHHQVHIPWRLLHASASETPVQRQTELAGSV